jgi:predicted TIM-barrel fold metal-dependent hydrolase
MMANVRETRDFLESKLAGFKPEVHPLILKENAKRLLGLDTITPGVA